MSTYEGRKLMKSLGSSIDFCRHICFHAKYESWTEIKKILNEHGLGIKSKKDLCEKSGCINEHYLNRLFDNNDNDFRNEWQGHSDGKAEKLNHWLIEQTDGLLNLSALEIGGKEKIKLNENNELKEREYKVKVSGIGTWFAEFTVDAMCPEEAIVFLTEGKGERTDFSCYPGWHDGINLYFVHNEGHYETKGECFDEDYDIVVTKLNSNSKKESEGGMGNPRTGDKRIHGANKWKKEHGYE